MKALVFAFLHLLLPLSLAAGTGLTALDATIQLNAGSCLPAEAVLVTVVGLLGDADKNSIQLISADELGSRPKLQPQFGRRSLLQIPRAGSTRPHAHLLCRLRNVVMASSQAALAAWWGYDDPDESALLPQSLISSQLPGSTSYAAALDGMDLHRGELRSQQSQDQMPLRLLRKATPSNILAYADQTYASASGNQPDFGGRAMYDAADSDGSAAADPARAIESNGATALLAEQRAFWSNAAKMPQPALTQRKDLCTQMITLRIACSSIEELSEKLASLVDSQELQKALIEEGYEVMDIAMLFANQRIYSVPQS